MIRIDTTSSVPVYEQIMLQIKYAVARGAYRPGDVLPSVRQLALDTLVNPNTVARAYRELEREGIVRTERGRGIFVADRSVGTCRQDGRRALEERLRATIAEAGLAGIRPNELETMFSRQLKRGYLDEADGSGSFAKQKEDE